MTTEEISFSKQMRLATRDVHKISDALINAKLAFALSNDRVWADGLLIFYEIFKYLEENVPATQLPIEYHRTKAFELDLEFYFGAEWRRKTNPPRSRVQDYLQHLMEIKRKEPMLLIAYVYHLYMGLLSGGQILKNKRQLWRKVNVFERRNDSTISWTTIGYAVTDFNGATIGELKTKMRSLVDCLAMTLNTNIKQEIIEESRQVFYWNNEIVHTVEGVNKVTMEKIGYIVVVSILLFYAIQWYRR